MVSKSSPAGLELEDSVVSSELPGRLPFDLIAVLIMAVVGFGISVYLTTVHYANAPLVCSTGGIVSCSDVTRSSYSFVPGTGMPITIPGMLWFVISAALAALSWQAQSGRSTVLARFGLEEDGKLLLRLGFAQLAWCVAGLAAVFYLVYAELVKLHKICEWCTGVHILTALTFFVALYRCLNLLDGGDLEEEGAGQSQSQ